MPLLAPLTTTPLDVYANNLKYILLVYNNIQAYTKF